MKFAEQGDALARLSLPGDFTSSPVSATVYQADSWMPRGTG